MITRCEHERALRLAGELVARAGLVCRPDELAGIEVADLGLGRLHVVGLQMLTWVNTDAISVKLLILLPNQTFAEHRHPAIDGYAGKEETIRGQWGDLRLYVEGQATAAPVGAPPTFRGEHYLARHEIVLAPGQQHTIAPHTWHWFQAGPEGAIGWSFATKATDVQDEFADPAVTRLTMIVDESRPDDMEH